jgi:soluble lytic murein transglycosylase-like protein
VTGLTRLLWFCALLGTATAADTRIAAVACANYYADRYGVPRELVHAVIEVESVWQPHAVSPAGAVGLMQLMPATAVTFGVSNRFRIEENVRGGVAYLAWLMRRFDGDLRLVTAAYYAGETRIALRGLDCRSPEVYEYVSKVARVYRMKRLETLRAGR